MFDRVEAAQKLRRETRESASAAKAMREKSQCSVDSMHAALAEYRSAFVEGNGMPSSVKQRIVASSSSQPNLRMTPTPCRGSSGGSARGTTQGSKSHQRGLGNVHIVHGPSKEDEARQNVLGRTSEVYKKRAERAKRQRDAACRARSAMDEERILAGGASARELELVGHFAGLHWKSVPSVYT